MPEEQPFKRKLVPPYKDGYLPKTRTSKTRAPSNSSSIDKLAETGDYIGEKDQTLPKMIRAYKLFRSI